MWAKSAAVLRKAIAQTANNAHGLQFWASSWSADYPDAQDFTSLQFGKGAPYNTMNYGQNKASDVAQQQTVQAQLVLADGNTDETVRAVLYQSAEQLLINDVAWLPLYQTSSAVLLKSYVKGVNIQFAMVPPTENRDGYSVD